MGNDINDHACHIYRKQSASISYYRLGLTNCTSSGIKQNRENDIAISSSSSIHFSASVRRSDPTANGFNIELNDEQNLETFGSQHDNIYLEAY